MAEGNRYYPDEFNRYLAAIKAEDWTEARDIFRRCFSALEESMTDDRGLETSRALLRELERRAEGD